MPDVRTRTTCLYSRRKQMFSFGILEMERHLESGLGLSDYCYNIFRGHVWWLSILFAVCLIFKGIVIKNENYIIIYSPLCCCKTVWLSFWNIEGWVFHRISKLLFSIKHKYTILFKSFIWKGCIKWIKTAKMKTTFQINFIFNFLFIR